MGTFVAFGNLEKRFTRMSDSVRAQIASMPRPVVIQAGANQPAFSDVPPYVTVFPTCDFEQFERLLGNSTVVITHGGVGTIQAAVAGGLRPAVFARQGEMGEHIDNHQVEWCRELFAAGLGVEMQDAESLRQYLGNGQFVLTDQLAATRFFDCSALRADLHGHIRAMVAGK